MLNSLTLKEESSRDLGSPGNRQLLQLQLFSPKKISNFGPPHDFNVALNRLDPGPIFGHALILNDLLKINSHPIFKSCLCLKIVVGL